MGGTSWKARERKVRPGAAKALAALAFASLLAPSPLSCARNGAPDPAPARAGVSEWTILGLDVPDYASNAHAKIAPEERGWIRHHKLEVRWAEIQPGSGSFDWSYYDRQIGAVLADGSQSILLLIGGPVPEWARDPARGEFAGRAPPARLADWYRFCREVAGRYGTVVDFYEIWNEPGWDRDAEAFRLYGTYHFGGQVESDYLPLLQLGYRAVKEADPSGLVICGALIDTLEDDPAAGTDMYVRLFGGEPAVTGGVRVEVRSDRPVLAERPVAPEEGADGAGARPAEAEAEAARRVWVLAAPGGEAGADRVRLRNPGSEPARVMVKMTVEGIGVAERQASLAGGGGEVLDVGELCGFGASCDMVAVHPYKMPGNWGPFYATLASAMRSIGVDKELVVTEVGWPHYTDNDPTVFSESQQADALGEWGLGPLRDAGCRKIWIYKDIDESPGKSWDKCYFGLFAHDGTPHPSWQRYKEWQAANPSYPQLPASL